MAYINKEFIEDLLSSIRIEEYFHYNYQAKKQGSSYIMKSPFTDEKTASFVVSPQKQIWKDFSSNKGGTLVGFVMEKENCSFPEAIEKLAKYANKEVVYDDTEKGKALQEKKQKQEALRPLVVSTINKYKKYVQDEKAQKEIKKRGYNEEDIIEWQLAYAPGGKTIADETKRIGRISDAKALGLVSEKGYDTYQERLIIPIHDRNGLLIGLAGRDLSGRENSAKWINPKQSDLYNKDKVWFGLHKAISSIRNEKGAIIVEGYNDVIAFHKAGLINTVASCGTSITETQLKELAKYTNKVTLCLDGDKAGLKAVEKYIPLLIKLDVSVEVCILPEALDPDDFCRKYDKEIKEFGIVEVIKPYTQNGFKYLLNLKLNEVSDTEKVNNVKELCQIIIEMKDPAKKEIYIAWLQKESNFNKTLISSIIKGLESDKAIKEANKKLKTDYLYPKLEDSSPEKLKEIEADVKKYKMFQANNRIYFLNSDEYTFKYISNFSIEIIQHMVDDKFPKKLVRIKNVDKIEKIFDTDSSNLLTPLAFEKAVTDQGNFYIDINAQELKHLKRYLFDKMGSGRKIDILGWQPDGKFWVWNNQVYVPGEGEKPITEYGVFEKDGVSYYIPSANEIYKNQRDRFTNQKKFIVRGNLTLEQYSEKLRLVHRDHAISAILFGVASIFQDIIVDKSANFPILFFYGQSGTGKSQLSLACQSLFGVPQPQTNLEQGLSTGKANVRLFAQFSNSVCVLNEYMVGNKDIEGLLKSTYDRDGYNRGTLDSKVSTDTVPILSSAILTGNYAPNVESTMSRLIWEEIQKDKFTKEDSKNFDDVEDILKSGVSNITNKLLSYRSVFDEHFIKQYRMYKTMFTKRDSMKNVKGRLIQNVAVLGATYNLLKENYVLPFSAIEMNNHFDEIVLNLHKKMSANSISTKFWDVFLFCIRRNDTAKLKIDQDYNSEGDTVFFNFSNIYTKIQIEWWPRFHETCPGKMQLKRELEKSTAFVDKLSSKPMGTGRGAVNTSVVRFDISKLEDYDILAQTIEYIKYNSGNPETLPFPPATPNNEMNNDSNSRDQAPF